MDPIPFRESFKFEIEHWPWISPWPNTGRDYFSSVSFWYQKSIHKAWPRLKQVISNEPWDAHKGRWHVADAVEAESLEVLEYESSIEKNPRPTVQHEMPNLSGDHMLAFDSGGKGRFSLAIPVEDPSTYTVAMYYTRAPDCQHTRRPSCQWTYASFEYSDGMASRHVLAQTFDTLAVVGGQKHRLIYAKAAVRPTAHVFHNLRFDLALGQIQREDSFLPRHQQPIHVEFRQFKKLVLGHKRSTGSN